ncbi:hypothetical protein D3C84_819200 [compost metagenome]
MAADTDQANGRHVGRGAHGPRLADEHAHRKPRHVVQGVDRIAGKALEQAVFDHPPGAAQGFLGGLEDQVEGAVELARLGQVAGSAEQDGGMAVMAAGVHLAGIAAGVGHAAFFLDRQGVHVRADADAAVATAVLEGTDDARAADTLEDLITPLAQVAGHQLAGDVLLETELGVLVDPSPNLREFILPGQYLWDQLHGLPLLS